MFDVEEQIAASRRSIDDLPMGDQPGRSVRLNRVFEAGLEDVWDACTTQDRLSRWVGPVSGDFRVGGEFRIEGNAHGEVLLCEPPRLLRVTWILDPGVDTEVQLTLTEEPAGTRLCLEHTAPAKNVDELIRSLGPGITIGMGIGWDLALVGLSLLLAGIDVDPSLWATSSDVTRFAAESGRAWGTVVQHTWNTTDEVTAAAVAVATSQPGTPQ